MADERPGADRRALNTALLAAVGIVAVLTLLPAGSGYEWASPAAEIRWYAAGLGSERTLLQLLGNVVLLAVPAALAVLRWPALAQLPRLVAAAVAAAAGIELLQFLLPLGRVVSPLDALLNTTGAVVAGLLVSRAAPVRTVP
jgi:hypothetical protein